MQGTQGEQARAALTSSDGRSIVRTVGATIDVDGSVLLQRQNNAYLVPDEDLHAVVSIAYMNNQTNNQTDGHWYGTFSTYMILGVARTSDYVSFITGRGHEVRLVRQEDDGSQWEVLYIQPGQAPQYLAEEEDEGDGRGRLLVTLQRTTLDDAFVTAYAVRYADYF